MRLMPLVERFVSRGQHHCALHGQRLEIALRSLLSSRTDLMGSRDATDTVAQKATNHIMYVMRAVRLQCDEDKELEGIPDGYSIDLLLCFRHSFS